MFPDLEILLHGFLGMCNVMRRSHQVVFAVKHHLHRQMSDPVSWGTERCLRSGYYFFSKNETMLPWLPEPSSPIMWPQPPQLTCEPSGLTNLQLEPVPEIKTMPPAETSVLNKYIDQILLPQIEVDAKIPATPWQPTTVTGCCHCTDCIGGN